MSEAKKQDPTLTIFPREAAVLRLEQLLAPKQKGDHITSREVVDATGFVIESMRGRLRTWARKKGFVLVPVPGDGYRVLADSEHVDRARRRAEAEARAAKETLRGLLVTDASKLDDAQVRRHEFITAKQAARTARAEADVKETKREFKLTERVPLRVLADPSKK